MRLIAIIIWGLVGLCLFLAGCRAGITAEKLEASLEIYRADYHIGQTAEPDRD
jgi:hypothetical protein